MRRLTDYLVVVSFDCLSGLDFALLEGLPYFQELLEDGSFCRNVETIYPSVTYPCHATIVTGNFPNRHGVINNTFLQPGRTSPDWYWQRRHVKGTTLYDEARKAGMKTAALLWPVTARANIDYNLPEIFANRPWLHQVPVSLWNGSPLYQLEMQLRFGSIRKGIRQPELDDFVTEVAVQTILDKKPHLMLIHLTDLDTQRHHHGFSSKEAMAALNRHNIRLGKILHALKESGIYENSTIIALGDHSALDESKAIKLNVLLREHGLIKTNSQGKITDWRAYCKSCDGSAYIYLKGEKDTAARELVNNLLHHLLEDKNSCLEEVLTGTEAAQRGADGKAAFMLEASLGYYFKEDLRGDFLEEIEKNDVRKSDYTKATHGYSPKKNNYSTVFIAAGKGIRKSQEISSMHLVDEGPTLARLLGLDLGKTDGRVIQELLNN